MSKSVLDSQIERPTWDELHMLAAMLPATRSSCLIRAVGAAIVRDNRVIAAGYNGAPNGIKSCLDTSECYYQAIAWQDHKTGHGKFEDLKEMRKLHCLAVHAEVNAQSQLTKFGPSSIGATLYITNVPCPACARNEIIIKGIVEVKVWKEYLKNTLITIDEARETERLLSEAKIPLSFVHLPHERIGEICQLLFSVGMRTSYKFQPK